MGSILLSELQWRHSGGSTNADPNLSIGGGISNFQVSDSILNSLFSDVSTAEALAGETSYRCLYIYNANTTDPFQGGNLWMDVLPGGDATMSIAPDPGGLNTTPTAIADEFTAPSGVTFVNATSEITAVLIGDIPALGRYPIWVKRVQAVNASPPSQNAQFRLLLKGLLYS